MEKGLFNKNKRKKEKENQLLASQTIQYNKTRGSYKSEDRLITTALIAERTRLDCEIVI
jgi:hypothetical protein